MEVVEIYASGSTTGTPAGSRFRSWEAAEEIILPADFVAIRALLPKYARRRLAAPHTWRRRSCICWSPHRHEENGRFNFKHMTMMLSMNESPRIPVEGRWPRRIRRATGGLLAGLSLLRIMEAAAADRCVFPQDPSVLDLRRDFGAKGDGMADDTAALQAAIEASSNRGQDGGTKILYLPDGTYRVTSNLVVTARVGPWVYGESRDGVIIRLADGVPTNVTAVLRTHPSDTQASSADFFMRNFRHLTIDVGRNAHAGAVRFLTDTGGQTEILGLFNCAPNIAQDDQRPAFDVVDADFSAAGVRETSFGNTYPVKARERRGEETRTEKGGGWIGWALFRGGTKSPARRRAALARRERKPQAEHLPPILAGPKVSV